MSSDLKAKRLNGITMYGDLSWEPAGLDQGITHRVSGEVEGAM
jgi:hypothetical protein